MPQTSLYQPVRTQIIKSSYQNWDNMTADQFATKLVSKLTQKEKPAMVYLGSKLWFAYLMSFIAWCASWFIGVRFWDLVASPVTGMGELKKIVQKEGREAKKKI
jgi:1-acylglycerone phosphate reductase